MLYLGIDQSLACPGVAVLDEEGEPLTVDSVSVSPGLRAGDRLAAVARFVLGAVRTADPDGVEEWAACIEGPNLNAPNPQTLFDLGECAGAIKAALWAERRLVPVVVEPARLKSFATGNGLADKAAVVHAVKELWGVVFDPEKDDDKADALVLAKIAHAVHTETFTRRCQADVVYALRGDRPSPRAAKRKTRLKNLRTENL